MHLSWLGKHKMLLLIGMKLFNDQMNLLQCSPLAFLPSRSSEVETLALWQAPRHKLDSSQHWASRLESLGDTRLALRELWFWCFYWCFTNNGVFANILICLALLTYMCAEIACWPQLVLLVRSCFQSWLLIFIFKDFIVLFSTLSVWGESACRFEHVSGHGPCRSEASDPLEMELQSVLGCLVW